MYFKELNEENLLNYTERLKNVKLTNKKTTSYKNLVFNYYKALKNEAEIRFYFEEGENKNQYIIGYYERLCEPLEIKFQLLDKRSYFTKIRISLSKLNNNNEIGIFKEIVKKFIEYAQENFATKSNAVIIDISDHVKEVKKIFSDVNIPNVEKVSVRNVFYLIDKSGNCDLTAIRELEKYVELFRDEFNTKEMSSYSGHNVYPFCRNEYNFNLEINNVPFYITIKENADGDVRVVAEIMIRVNDIPKFDVTDLIDDGNNLRKVCSEVLIKTIETFKDEKDKLIIELLKHDIWSRMSLERIKVLNDKLFVEIAEVMGMEMMELYVSCDTIDWKKMITVHRTEDVVIYTFSILKEKYYHLINEGEGCFTDRMLLNREQYEQYWIERMK